MHEGERKDTKANETDELNPQRQKKTKTTTQKIASHINQTNIYIYIHTN